MAADVHFYWDVGSTNSYFAYHLLKPVCDRHGARIVPHPFNLGHVFRSKNYVLMDEEPEKIAYRIADLMRWARLHDLPFNLPESFPIKTSRVLRGALAMRRFDREWDYMGAVLAAYWERGDATIADYAGLRPIVAGLGVDADAFERLAEDPAVRAELVAETDAGLQRGAFGAPTMFVGAEMFWGKDRMDFIDIELARQRA